MSEQERIDALAAALHVAHNHQHDPRAAERPHSHPISNREHEEAAAILAALPPDWCGHDPEGERLAREFVGSIAVDCDHEATHRDAWITMDNQQAEIARLREIERAHRYARAVATIWRGQYLAMHQKEGGYWAIGTHPLALVLAALDGETEPAELGCNDDALRAALDQAEGER